MLYEKYSHNNQYKFEITQETSGGFLVKLFSYQKDWKDYFSVAGMEQICQTMDEGIKLGTAMLALLE